MRERRRTRRNEGKKVVGKYGTNPTGKSLPRNPGTAKHGSVSHFSFVIEYIRNTKPAEQSTITTHPFRPVISVLSLLKK